MMEPPMAKMPLYVELNTRCLQGEYLGREAREAISQRLRSMDEGGLLVVDFTGAIVLDYRFVMNSVGSLFRQMSEQCFGNKYCVLAYTEFQKGDLLFGLYWSPGEGKVSIDFDDLPNLLKSKGQPVLLSLVHRGEVSIQYMGLKDEMEEQALALIARIGEITPMRLSSELGIPHREAMEILEKLFKNRLVYLPSPATGQPGQETSYASLEPFIKDALNE